jgi:alkanesulfonate monooxygenase SsuD/methylene tetrahydromethanopterin reductase-like flavin-dependent oxidoreductase (luciferase family)
MRSYPYECLWLCDEFQYEDSFGTMVAMAIEHDVSLGTMVTFPWRNPLDLAQRFATIAKFVKPGRHVVAGIGAGGTVQKQVLQDKSGSVATVTETIQLMRDLLAGEPVLLGRFPNLAAAFRYRTSNFARLHFPPPIPVPVLLAAAGPRMYEAAGAYADGVILSQLLIRTSYLGAKAGMVHEAMRAVDAARSMSADRAYSRIYNIHVSVARDRGVAKQWAKRNTSYCLSGAYIRYPEVLRQLGLDVDEIGHVAQAYHEGLGVEEAARRVSDALVDQAGCVFAGTPEEVTEQVLDLQRLLSDLDFDQIVIGVPLGPNIPDALELISREVLPKLLADVSV